MGLGRFAEHVEAVAPALRLLRRGALQRLVDGAAEHELTAEDLHRLADRGADHRLAKPAHRPAKRGTPAVRLVVGFLEHLAGQQQRECRGVDEGRAAVAQLLGPIRARQFVGDQLVGGFGVGDAQQRLGEAHQRDALVRSEVVSLEKGVEPRRLMGPNRLDQRPGDGAGFALLRGGQLGLGKPLLDHLILIGTVGKAERGTIDHLALSGNAFARRIGAPAEAFQRPVQGLSVTIFR